MNQRTICKGLAVAVILLFVGLGIQPTIAYENPINPNSKGNILYVGGSGPNNYTTIQDAIDGASDGDIVFIYDDSSPYKENIIVDKSLSLIGEDKNTTIIDGSKVDNVISISADNVKIYECLIKASGTHPYNSGISVTANNTIIDSSNINSNEVGIYTEYSTNNIFINNNFLNNWCGIYQKYSYNSTIIGNLYSNNSYSIINFNSSNSNIILNNILNNSNNGIYLHFSTDNIITNNNISNNNNTIESFSIFVEDSNGNIITDNILSNNGYGIKIKDSISNTIIGNIISENRFFGILISYSSNTVMKNNKIQDNKYNFDVIGNHISHFYHDIDTTNTINDKPIYYTLEQSDLIFDDSMSIGYLSLVSCYNINVKNLKFTNQKNHGLSIVKSSKIIITNCTIYSNGDNGIYLLESNSNTITDNNISNNDYGICLENSTGNIITDNLMTKNGYHLPQREGSGLYLLDSRNNIISGNTITLNDGDGIEFKSSSSNIIKENTISLNKDEGINFDNYSTNNTLTFNNIISNNDNGVMILGFNNTIKSNIISHNEDGIILMRFNNIIRNNIISNNYFSIYLENSDNNNVTKNIITDNGWGIIFKNSNNNTIKCNNISLNKNGGITLKNSQDNIIKRNTISNNYDGINLYSNSSDNLIISNNIFLNKDLCIFLKNSSYNIIIKNNFYSKKLQTYFVYCKKNKWNQNYWNKPRFLPKFILGKIEIDNLVIPWFNIDWHPAKKLYDI